MLLHLIELGDFHPFKVTGHRYCAKLPHLPTCSFIFKIKDLFLACCGNDFLKTPTPYKQRAVAVLNFKITERPVSRISILETNRSISKTEQGNYPVKMISRT